MESFTAQNSTLKPYEILTILPLTISTGVLVPCGGLGEIKHCLVKVFWNESGMDNCHWCLMAM